MIGTLIFALCAFSSVHSLDNGLALTPPMGWMHWQRFRCLVDCEAYPDECISEQLFRTMTDHLAADGYLDAGYNYIIIDDCWMSHERDEESRLTANKTRFPSGIPALADYVHKKGLKLGIYADYGKKTCAGYPGSIDYLETDANTFAEWGVDYLKLDGCYADIDILEPGYIEMGKYLNKTGRPIVYSCSWPAYQEPKGVKCKLSKILWCGHLVYLPNTFPESLFKFSIFAFENCAPVPEFSSIRSRSNYTKQTVLEGNSANLTFRLFSRGRIPNYTALAESCNLWRNWDDIDDTWSNVTNILEWFSTNQDRIASFAGPGHWNDPDMLIIGNFGLSYEQSKAQMAIWAILAAPLIMSVDLRTIEPKFRDILLNKEAIRINQDPLGIQGRLILNVKKIDIWTRPILPKDENNETSYAIGFLSHRVDGYPYRLNVTLAELNITAAKAYTIRDVFEPKNVIAHLSPKDELIVRVKPTGVVFLTATPITAAE